MTESSALSETMSVTCQAKSTIRLPMAKSIQVGVGITTRDRWDDLAVTLSELKTNGYEDVETIVIDDGSKRPLPPALRAGLPESPF